MKTLKNKVIIYDDVCPLCQAYTEGFVQLGWLMPENRIGFANAPADIIARIDINRARHEIPLYDRETKQTIYGKEALFFIIGEQMPVLRPLFRFSLFRGLIYVLYQIITYNRRIIAGSKAPKEGFDCAPDFNLTYRLVYIGLAASGSLYLSRNMVLSIDNQYFIPLIVLMGAILWGIIPNPRGGFYRDFTRKIDYFGHLATVVLVLLFLTPFVNGTLPLMLLGVFMMWRRMR